MRPPFSWVSGKPRTRHYLAIDIGSHSAIRSLLFGEVAGERIALAKRAIELPTRKDTADLVSRTMDSLGELLTAALRTIGRRPDAVLLGLGSRATRSATVVVRRSRDRAQNPVLERELRAMLETFFVEHRERVINGRRYQLASVVPLDTRLDGSPVAVIPGATRGRMLELVLFATYLQTAYGEALAALRTHFAGMAISTIPNQIAIAAGLVTLHGIREAAVVKIGARDTEVSLMHDANINATGSLPLGGDAVTAAIAERTRLGRSVAERIKRQWGRIRLPAPVAQAIQTAMHTSARQWRDALAALLRRESRPLPAHLYLTGGGAGLGALSTVLAEPSGYGSVPEGRAPSVSVLGAEYFTASFFRNVHPVLAGPEESALAAIATRLAGGRVGASHAEPQRTPWTTSNN